MRTIAGTYGDEMAAQSIEAFLNSEASEPSPNEVVNKLHFLLKMEAVPFEEEKKRF